MKRLAFALFMMCVVLSTYKAYAKDKVHFVSYVNGIATVEYGKQVFSGTCEGTTVGLENGTTTKAEGCGDANGFAGHTYPVCADIARHGKLNLSACMGADEKSIGLLTYPPHQFVVVRFKTLSVTEGKR